MSRYGLRLGLLLAASLVCGTVTTSATASPAEPIYDQTASVTMSYGNVILVTVSDADLLPAFLPSVITPRQVNRDFPAYRAAHSSPRASGAAVRPTSVAGWRSGRTRHLATG